MSAPRSGFLTSYEQLQADPADPRRLIYRRADVRWESFTGVLIEPVRVNVNDLTPDEAKALSAALEGFLAQSFSGRFPIVARAGPGVLRVRTAVTDVRRANVGMNILTTLVAAPLVNGGAAGEAEILDSSNGQRLAAISWGSSGSVREIAGFYASMAHAEAALKRFAERIADLTYPEARSAAAPLRQ